MGIPRDGTTVGAQGIRLHLRTWDAPRPRGAVLLLHGLGEHSGRYRPLADALGRRGYSLFAFDLRGHGRSQGPRGEVDLFSRFLEDLLAVEEVMDRQLGAGVPRFLLGHSLGGLIALRRLQTASAPFQGGILSAPWIGTALPEWLCRLGDLLGLAAPLLTVPSGLGAERLTRDPDMMKAWREDPLIHTRVTARLFREARRAQREAWRMAHRLALPLLFLVPQDDHVARSSATEEFARGIVGGEVRVEILEGRKHEPFNDLGREEVFALVGDWLERRTGPAPGAA